MAATRLRRTFQYPSESDDEDAVEQGMDEQDQETLISSLSQKDTSSTRIYTAIFSTFPLVLALFSLPLLANLSTALPTLLAITSFVASAYTLYYLPLPPIKVGIITTSDLKPENAKKRGGYGWNIPSTPEAKAERKPVPWLSDAVVDLAAQYIVRVNGAVCVVLAIYELYHRRTWSEGVGIGGGYLPGFVLGVVLWARRELRVMDLGELEKLKYTSKAM